LAEKYMGIEKARLHDGTPLAELFDSLCLLELVMLLERELLIDVEIPSHARKAGERIDACELARSVVRQHAARATPFRRATFMPLPGLAAA
jgi:hypothetical protein